jgi:hypothetical protein
MGFLGQNLKNVSTEVRYLSGAIVCSGSQTATAVPTGRDLYVMARNGGAPDQFIAANLTGFYVAQNMTDRNMTDLIADWAVMNNTLGR